MVIVTIRVVTEILLQATSPDGNAEAVVEDDGQTVYLYLVERGQERMKPLWIANRSTAPTALDRHAMAQGEAPMNPRAYCAHPNGLKGFSAEGLELVWLPEGNGVGLRRDGLLIAAIPGWAGEGGFRGYSADTVGTGPLAWELSQDNAMHRRFEAASEFWRDWEASPNPWELVQEAQLKRLEQRFGKHERYFSIDGEEWPPRALVWFKTSEAQVLATIGMCLRPMPNVEQFTDDAHLLRRIELGAVLPSKMDERVVYGMAEYLSAQARLPWRQRTWLGHGHTVGCGVLETRGFEAVAMMASRRSNFSMDLPECQGDPVTLLWAVPITAAERAQAEQRGTAELLGTIQLPR